MHGSSFLAANLLLAIHLDSHGSGEELEEDERGWEWEVLTAEEAALLSAAATHRRAAVAAGGASRWWPSSAAADIAPESPQGDDAGGRG